MLPERILFKDGAIYLLASSLFKCSSNPLEFLPFLCFRMATRARVTTGFLAPQVAFLYLETVRKTQKSFS